MQRMDNQSCPWSERLSWTRGNGRQRKKNDQKKADYWSGKRDLNPRPSPWQGDALPLSYSRSITSRSEGWNSTDAGMKLSSDPASLKQYRVKLNRSYKNDIDQDFLKELIRYIWAAMFAN